MGRSPRSASAFGNRQFQYGQRFNNELRIFLRENLSKTKTIAGRDYPVSLPDKEVWLEISFANRQLRPSRNCT
jgi:hypothetical protein